MKNLNKEIIFDKYHSRGSDYHYQEINKRNIFKFNAYLFARYQLMLEKILESFTKNKNEKNSITLLDVGCGDGVLIYLLRKKNNKRALVCHGIDVIEDAIETARKKNDSNCFFKTASGYKIPYPDKYFDIIISSDAIEHVKYPSKMLSEIHRVAKKNAKILISTPVRLTEQPLDLMHVHEFFPDEFNELLKKYFSKTKIHLSHQLFFQTIYLKTFPIWRYRFPILRYMFNFLYLITGINAFVHKTSKISDYPTYMMIESVNTK